MTTAALPGRSTPAPADSAAPAARSSAWRDPMVMITIAAVIGGLALALIGFAGSYVAVRDLAVRKGFGDFAPFVPIGIDAGIVACLALDLHLIRRHTPWPLLRTMAHGLTLATIAFNAASAWGDELAVAMHAVIPILFIASVEAARRLVIQAARLETGTVGEGIPVARWLLAPLATVRLWRRMRLRGITSYRAALELDQAHRVYGTLLREEHGSPRKAPPLALLPVKLARYGLSPAEALAAPSRQAEVDAQREAEAAERAADEAHARQLRQRQRDAELAEAEARAAAAADARRREAQAAESATAAAARRRAAEDDAAAAEREQHAAERRTAAAELALRAADTEARAAALARRAADDETATVEARAKAVEAEARAVEAEDLLRLTPTERDARRVARMAIRQHGGDVDAIPGAEIAALLNVSTATASNRRTEARQLLAAGYREGI